MQADTNYFRLLVSVLCSEWLLLRVSSRDNRRGKQICQTMMEIIDRRIFMHISCTINKGYIWSTYVIELTSGMCMTCLNKTWTTLFLVHSWCKYKLPRRISWSTITICLRSISRSINKSRQFLKKQLHVLLPLSQSHQKEQSWNSGNGVRARSVFLNNWSSQMTHVEVFV